MTAARRRFERTHGADLSGLDKRQARRILRRWGNNSSHFPSAPQEDR